MVYINNHDYLEKKTITKARGGNQPSKRNWWFGKEGVIHFGLMRIPKRFYGKKIMFKVVEVNDEKNSFN